LAIAGGALVAAGRAVGAPGGLVAGAVVAEETVEFGADPGVAVADDPQATSRMRLSTKDENRKKPGFLKEWDMISEPPDFNMARILWSPNGVSARTY